MTTIIATFLAVMAFLTVKLDNLRNSDWYLATWVLLAFAVAVSGFDSLAPVTIDWSDKKLLAKVGGGCPAHAGSCFHHAHAGLEKAQSGANQTDRVLVRPATGTQARNTREERRLPGMRGRHPGRREDLSGMRLEF